MPADDGRGLHDPDGSAPPCPHSREPHPQEPVGPTEARPFRSGLLEHGQLMAQGKNLGFKFNPCSDAGANGGEYGNQDGAHTSGTISARRGQPQEGKAYRISDRDTMGRVFAHDGTEGSMTRPPLIISSYLAACAALSERG